MAKLAQATTFLDEIELRHDSFRAIEDGGALQIRHEMNRVREQMVRTLETGVETITAEGRFLTTAAARRRAQGLIKEIDSILERGISTVDGSLLALKEGAFQTGIRDFQIATHFAPEALPTSLVTSFDQLFPEAAGAALTNPVLGVRPSQMWKGVEAGTIDDVRKTLLNAVITGESVTQTAQKISESLDVAVNAAERIARTNLNAMYNDAHLLVINRNSDIFAGYRWVAALDDRTSAICIRLHGTFFPIGTVPPGPPAHWNCRSIIQGVFKNPEIQASMMTDTQRVKNYQADGSFKDGFINTSTSSEAWLKRQPAWVKQQVLGSRVKVDMFTAGKATIEDIVSPAMLVRTDKQFLRRLAALNPQDRALQILAKSKGVHRVPSAKLIQAEDRALARGQWFEQPTPMPNPNAAPVAVQTELPAPTKTPPKDPLPSEVVSHERLVDDYEQIMFRRESQQELIERAQKDLAFKRKIFPGSRRAEIIEAEELLAERRSIASVLKQKSDDAWAKIESTIPSELQPARLLEEYLPFNLTGLRVTRAEFSALKSDLDDLAAARKAALKRNPRRPKTAKADPWFSAQQNLEKKRYAFEMNRTLKADADGMARSRIIMHRAQEEMGDLYQRMLATNPIEARYMFRDALKARARSDKFTAIKRDIIDNMRLDLRNSVTAKVDQIDNQLSHVLDMMDDKLFESGGPDWWQNIDWTEVVDRDFRAFARARGNVLHASIGDDVSVWMHEFGHHVEFRGKTAASDRGWRGWTAFKRGDRYGSTGNKGEDGFLGVFYDDYVARDYPKGWTQTVSMGTQAVFNTEYMAHMLASGPEHFQWIWSVYRGATIWK